MATVRKVLWWHENCIRENLYLCKYNEISMHSNDIFIHENAIFMYENEGIAYFMHENIKTF